jgi:hypothetical protein
MSALEYRHYEEECIGWARNARSAQEREMFLELASAWSKLLDSAATQKQQSEGDAASDSARSR